jgi:hypothetical protein
MEFEEGAIQKRLRHPQFEGSPIPLLSRTPGGRLPQVEDTVGQKSEEVRDHRGARSGTGCRIRRNFQEKKPANQSEDAGEGQLGKPTAFHPLFLGDILPLQVVPVELLKFFEEVGSLSGREGRIHRSGRGAKRTTDDLLQKPPALLDQSQRSF